MSRSAHFAESARAAGQSMKLSYDDDVWNDDPKWNDDEDDDNCRQKCGPGGCKGKCTRS